MSMLSEPLPGLPHPTTNEEALLTLYDDLRSIQSTFSGASEGIARPSWFICIDELRALLSEGYILDILRAIFQDQRDDGNLRAMAKAVIDKECCKIFTILATSNLGHIIPHVLNHSNDFRDTRLPINTEQLASKFNLDASTSATVSRLQRHFCVEAMSTERLDSSIAHDVILPVKSKKFLKSGSTAEVYKVELHNGYNHFSPRTGLGPMSAVESNDVFVLKTFSAKSRNAREYFEREVRAYTTIASDAAPERNLIGYYGSFEVRDAHDQVLSYNIILEHASGKTLTDLFQDPLREFPATADAFWVFWHQLFGIARGLDRLHVLRRSDADEALHILQGMHHDLKPDNILVLDDPDPEFRAFPYRFVIADLGLVTLHANNLSDGMVSDRRATIVYGAPETHRESWRDDWHIGVGPAGDVWALGCIISEALTWAVLGYAGLAAYRKHRSDMSGERGPIFHDGQKVSQVVTDQHEKCVQGTRQGDRLAEKIVAMLDDILTPESGRLSSMQIVQKANKILGQTKPGAIPAQDVLLRTPPPPRQSRTAPGRMSLSEPGTRRTSSVNINSQSGEERPSGRSSMTSKRAVLLRDDQDSGSPFSSTMPEEVILQTAPQRSPVQNGALLDPPPCVTIDELRRWKQSAKTRDPMDLPQMSYLNRLNDRDTIFVIDDSRSMRDHWPAVKDWLGLVAWTLKHHDPDELEYCFLSGGRIYKASNSTSLVNKVQVHGTSSSTPTTNAETRLESLFHEYVQGYRVAHDKTSSRRGWSFQRQPSGRPINYYILTDGKWEPAACNVSNAILRLLGKLENANPYQVGVSFIRFGNEQIGIDRLNALDDGMVEVKGASRDIVDHEPSNGNVLKMLLAPTNTWWDGVNKPSAAEKARWRWD